MKYLIVTQTFPPRTGGMQNVMGTISRKLANIKETHVFPDHFLTKNFNTFNSKIHIHNNFTPKILRHIVKRKLVSKVFEHGDIVICDSWKSVNAVPNVVKKIIVLAHGQEYLSIIKKEKLIKKSLDRATHIICSSNYTSNLIDKLSITKTSKSVIPPTYSLKKINKKKKLNHEQTIEILSMLSITRLEERKGLIPVLRALADLNDKKLLKPFLWKICGEGKQENEIKKSILDLNLTDMVKLIGKVTDEKKEQLLGDSDLFIMPSYKVKNSIEGFGISYIEAASYGIPSIAGVDGGIKDAVFDRKTGWCVNPLNSKELSNTLKEAINEANKRKKFGIEAQEKFLKIFLGEKVFGKFMKTIGS